ncbi:PIG-L family deacetylase [Pelobium manganitolerans]|uniref:PIG-L family deacetylase n=1 Tax=Pelobium manganitolerans TaxID=1842495 RepID=UPI003FA38616
MKLKLIFIYFLFINTFAYAQTSPQLNASEILNHIKKLGVTGSVLYIAAHPDDENTKLLAYLAKEKLYKTAYLSLTRGDGGQNLIGNEQGADLGLIRTQELLAARRNDGAQQFFTRAVDFGFSKTPEESLKIWNKDSILADVVYIIRQFRPNVIITRFPPDARAGHGHHSASSILAQEAFEAAADPKRFPEQLKALKVWQAQRILWNNYNFGGNDNTSDEQLKIDIGVYNPLLGKSYGEIAADSRSMHKSQGFGSAKQRGNSVEYFSAWRGILPQHGLMEGISTNWSEVKGAKGVDEQVAQLIQNFNPQYPEKSIPKLTALYQTLSALPKSALVNEKLVEVKNLILACAGLWIEAYAPSPFIAVNTDFAARVDAVAQVAGLKIEIVDWQKSFTLEKNQLSSVDGQFKARDLSQPYWLLPTQSIGRYALPQQSLLLYPEGKTNNNINLRVHINGINIDLQRPIVYKFTDPVRGEIYQPLSITPPVTANLEDKTLIFTGAEAKNIRVKLKSFEKGMSGAVTLRVPEGWTVKPEKIDFQFKSKDEEQFVSFSVSPSAKAKNGQLKAEIKIGNESYHQEIKTIDYPHIPSISYFPPAEAKLVKLNLKSSVKNVGYIVGAGDLIPETLRALGINVQLLSEADILNGDLSGFDAIIAGVRAYNVNTRMKFVQAKLLDYVANGGVYLVQYNVNRPLQMDNLGPYPFTITRDRVTEEDAKVSFAKPNSEALNYPNKITAADFEGWIQERGIYFADTNSPEYEKPLVMHDTGESAKDGSLLVANYGKGKFVYTGLVFFRELPAVVPGAYRLFMNLLASRRVAD